MDAFHCCVVVHRSCRARSWRAAGDGGNRGEAIALECCVELVAFVVVILLSVGIGHAAARLMMNSLLSAMTHRSRQSIR
jgi:Flp pilus assembly protein TadB